MSDTAGEAVSESEGLVQASAANLTEQEISGEVLLEKYAKGSEQNVTDVRRRVTRAFAAVESE
jgi:ribonucleoside-diphosphate reductase alpha chain